MTTIAGSGISEKAMERAKEAALRLSDTNRSRQLAVITLWTAGKSVSAICEEFGLPWEQVYEDVQAGRRILHVFQDDEVQALAAEAVGRFRHVIDTAYRTMEQRPQQVPQLLTSALRASEDIAKLQGVLAENKRIHKVEEHVIKLYDFRDNFPAPIQSTGTVVDVPEEQATNEQEVPQAVPERLFGEHGYEEAYHGYSVGREVPEAQVDIVERARRFASGESATI